jgi:hypothetical protein
MMPKAPRTEMSVMGPLNRPSPVQETAPPAKPRERREQDVPGGHVGEETHRQGEGLDDELAREPRGRR